MRQGEPVKETAKWPLRTAEKVATLKAIGSISIYFYQLRGNTSNASDAIRQGHHFEESCSARGWPRLAS